MHFEILVEDQSGKRMLDLLMPKLLGERHTFLVHDYKGIGRIPKGLKSGTESQRRIFLDQLPRLLQGYGKTFSNYGSDYPAVLLVICDLDDRNLATFETELFELLKKCNPAPDVRFCIAVEEGEAWLLGDLDAVKSAYPKAKDMVLKSYENDSICGTWELLADAVFPGGAKELKAQGWVAVGREKFHWAERISGFLDVEKNASPSFCRFRDNVCSLA